jgi:hypothetical protein
MIPVQLFSSSDDWPYMLARNSYWILGSCLLTQYDLLYS